LKLPLDFFQRDSSRTRRSHGQEFLESATLPQRLDFALEIICLGHVERLTVGRYQQDRFPPSPTEHRGQIDLLPSQINRYHNGTCFPRTNSTLCTLCPIEVTITD